jgi:Fungal Zn(2)-Cys(6) binuclear cluster domain
MPFLELGQYLLDARPDHLHHKDDHTWRATQGQDDRQTGRRTKVRTGCKACKRRKVKCDEGKPACQCCIRLGLECLGYAPPPKAWIFVPGTRHRNAGSSRLGGSLPYRAISGSEPSASKPSTDNPSPPTTGPGLEESKIAATCEGRGPAGHDRTCRTSSSDRVLLDFDVKANKARVLSMLLQPSGGYRTADEQFYLKYFLGVTASYSSRSRCHAQSGIEPFPKQPGRSRP